MVESRLTVAEVKYPAESYCELTLRGEQIPEIAGGQFMNVTVPQGDMILKRPFAISDCGKDFIKCCFKVVGKGTRVLRNVKQGDCLDVTYPLGNGFHVNGLRRVLLIGGGAGIFPLAAVAKLNPQIAFTAALGYANAEQCVYLDAFEKTCAALHYTTDDGSAGIRGNAITLSEEILRKNIFDAIFACGPLPMLRALKTPAFAGMEIQVSLEERMGCGIGACLCCAVACTDGVNRRVCKDGPVFQLSEVIL